MASHGGARNRSGPSFDPHSARSERQGIVLTALPNEGYDGDTPEWPLGPGPEHIAARELVIWADAWRTPQAAAWSLESWRWSIIAEYCRLKAIVEADPSASAALVAQLHRYRDQIGLTPAGMRENGWAIAQPEISHAAQSEVSDDDEGDERPERRMRAV